MNNKRFAVAAGLGCVTLFVAAVMVATLAFAALWVPGRLEDVTSAFEEPAAPAIVEEAAVEETLPIAETGRVEEAPRIAEAPQVAQEQEAQASALAGLPALYEQVNPGVVNIRVTVASAGGFGGGQGSGFVYGDEGYIVTNNHVVAGAESVTVVYHNGIEAEATVVGTDDDSDLAVIKVEQLPEGVHALPLANSDEVIVGQQVIAIGNPFGLGSSMTSGIVSAVGRTIESGATPFSIPQAIQTDAPINPGNSGGPLLSLAGEVVGVNAQIASNGTRANAGVGFAIPANIVRLVVPSLVENGAYEWPWLGIEGGSVNLAVMEANELERQLGAYIHRVTSGSPAAEAGLQGSRNQVQVDGVPMAVGGDVVIAIDGEPVANFDELLIAVAIKQPGESIDLTVLRDGQPVEVTVELAPRPSQFGA